MFALSKVKSSFGLGKIFDTGSKDPEIDMCKESRRGFTRNQLR